MKAAAKCIGLALCACFLTGLLFRPAAGYQLFVNVNGKNYAWNTAVIGPVRWSVAPGAPAIARESMLVVTEAWSRAVSGLLKFEEGAGGIEVIWDTDGTRIADPIYLAYTNFGANTNNDIISGRVVINARNYIWQRGGFAGVGPEINGVREVNLDSVLLHELGHALGIDHSDKNPGAIVGGARATDLPTMNSVIFPGAQTLHLDDESAARFLYLKNDPSIIEEFVISASPLKGKPPLDVAFDQFGGDDRTVWDFGDGSMDMAGKPTHRFVAPGKYTVFASSNGRVGQLVIEVEAGRKQKVPPRKRGKRARYSDSLPGTNAINAARPRE